MHKPTHTHAHLYTRVCACLLFDFLCRVRFVALSRTGKTTHCWPPTDAPVTFAVATLQSAAAATWQLCICICGSQRPVKVNNNVQQIRGTDSPIAKRVWVESLLPSQSAFAWAISRTQTHSHTCKCNKTVMNSYCRSLFRSTQSVRPIDNRTKR